MIFLATAAFGRESTGLWYRHRNRPPDCLVCLALGIGVNSAVFSIADNVSLSPLPFEEPDRLVALYSTRPSAGINTGRVSFQDFLDWREQSRSYADLGAYSYRSLSITEGVESERFQAAAVTSNLFGLLGVHPILGRQFTPADDRAGARPVVMLSHGLWQRRYASDQSIVGREIVVNGTAHMVVGVMPPRFQFPQVAQLWVPVVPLEHAASRNDRALRPCGRLAPGASVASASLELGQLAGQLARVHREDDGWNARAVALRDELMPISLQVATTAMMGAVLLVREGRFWSALLLSWMFSIFGSAALFLAAIGIYGVLSYSVAQRTQEFGVRVALGATRRSILALVVGQGVQLAAIGIVLGSGGAFMVTRLVRALLYNVAPTDPVSFGGMALVLAAVTVLAGCVPAGRATSVDPILALRAD